MATAILLNVLRAVNGYYRMPDAGLLQLVRNVIAKLTGNTNFTPSLFLPTLPQLTAQADAFALSATNATNGSKEQRDIRDADKALLAQMMHQLAAVCIAQANGSRSIMESSGIPLAKEAEPVSPLGPVRRMTVAAGGLPGQLKVGVDTQKGVLVYRYQYSTDPAFAEGTVTTRFDSRSSRLFTGLESGRIYYFQTSLIGRDDQLVHSTVMSAGVM